MDEHEFIERNEFKEYTRRMEDEHARQNQRISVVESALNQYHDLTIAVERMAVNMEQMLNEQIAQGNRLKALEARDGEMWRKALSYLVTTLIGIIVGYLFKQLGM